VWRSEPAKHPQAEQRASRLVEQTARARTGVKASAGLKLETIALNELVREVMLRFLPRAEPLGVDLGAEAGRSGRRARDKALIEGMLNNCWTTRALRQAAPRHA